MSLFSANTHHLYAYMHSFVAFCDCTLTGHSRHDSLPLIEVTSRRCLHFVCSTYTHIHNIYICIYKILLVVRVYCKLFLSARLLLFFCLTFICSIYLLFLFVVFTCCFFVSFLFVVFIRVVGYPTNLEEFPLQNGKNTPIRRTAVRETGVSRHNLGGTIN